MKTFVNLTVLLMVVLGFYALLILFVVFIQPRLPSKWMEKLPLVMLLGLTVIWTYLLFTDALHFKLGSFMLKKYGYLFQNMLNSGKWGAIWIAIGILLILSVFLKRMQHESVFVYGIFSFLILYNIVNIPRRGWRIGWGDSGNRILLHIVFVICFWLIVKYMNHLFPRRENQ